jgi:hypothetical protein
MARFRFCPDGRALSTLALAIAASFVAGCEEEEVPVVRIYHPTLVQVSPVEFLGGVPCVEAPGAMRSYVATVYDTGPDAPDGEGGSDGASEFALPSSTVAHGDVDGDGKPDATPTPCTQSVGFSRIIQGHRYWAKIEGYDRDDLVALAPGTSILYDPATSERVEPRWISTCSKQNPIIAYSGVARTIGTCTPLDDASPGTESLIEVSLDGALDGLECGNEPGTVERFDVVPPGEATLSASCGDSVTFGAPAGAGTTFEFPLRAFEASASEPSWGTTCVARVLAGVTTTATCLPLVSGGTLEVEPADALAALGLECGDASFEELTVEMTDGEPDTRHVDAATCASPIQFRGRAGGPATARATVRGASVGTALCTGTVVAGDTVRALCAREP